MKTKTILKLFFIILLLLLVALGIYAAVKPKKPAYEEVEQKEQPKEEQKDYLYSILYSFYNDFYIYVKEDKIEVYHRENLYEICPETDCIEKTEKVLEERKQIEFSEPRQKVVLEVLNNIHKRINKQDIDTNKEEITDYEERIILALILNSEEMVTIDEDISFIEKSENSVVSGVTFHNKHILIEKGNNKIIDKIADDLNPRVEQEYQDYKENKEKDADLYAKEGILNTTGTIVDLQMSYAGPHYVTFITVAGLDSMEVVDPDLRVYGYNYTYAGTIVEFPAGLKEKYFNKAIQVFYETPEYKQYMGDLLPGWRETFKEQMFKEGNWLIQEDKVSFFIQSKLLGIVPLKQPLILISVTREEDL